MQSIFVKRTLRELRAHAFRYLALALMIGLAIYLIVSLIGAADTVIFGTTDHAEKNHLEDGQFTTFVPLSEAELESLADRGLDVEPMFYREYVAKDESVLRIFKMRERIDLAELETGTFPVDESEIVLEKRYCEVKEIVPGDQIEFAGKTLTVSGIATSPDYDALFSSMGDSTVDSANFGTAFVTASLYDELAESGKSLQAEEYVYAYLLNGKMSDNELKTLLKDFSFDAETVEEPYFQEYWKQIYGERDELISGAENLAAFNPELRDTILELLDKYWKIENENLRSFVPAEDNPRIGASKDDVLINKYASILAGIIILALMAYVISVFVIHSIEEEQSTIGTLYALGIRRKELMRQYLILPVLICFLAGTVGTLIGYSQFGVPLQTADTYAYFSVPALDTVIELWVIIYGVVMPPLVAALVNWIVIRRKLSAPALQMIRNEEKHRTVSQLDLKNMGYLRRFQLRQMLREGRSAIGVVLGIFVCLLLMMIGINAYVLCQHVGKDNIRDTKYDYMYLYKYPEEKVPEGSWAAYAETLKKERFGYNLDVTVLGLEEGNPFFDAEPKESQNRVLISSAMAQKFGLKTGEEFLLNDTQNDRAYAFTVDGIVTYAPAFYVFMDIDSMRELFGAEESYYNVVFADHELDIDSGRLYSVSTKEDVEKAADIFVNLMYGMVYTMIIASAAIMGIVMYLMMKVMIDRSSMQIALFKVFGYRKRELGKLFLHGNTILIVLGAAISIPLSKIMMDAMYPYLVSNVACAINLRFEPWIYLALFGGILILYAVIHTLLVRRIDKIDLGIILKNRE